MNTLVGACVYVHTLNVNISNGGKFGEKGEEGMPGQKEKCLPTAPHVNIFSFQACRPGFMLLNRRFLLFFCSASASIFTTVSLFLISV